MTVELELGQLRWGTGAAGASRYLLVFIESQDFSGSLFTGASLGFISVWQPRGSQTAYRAAKFSGEKELQC